MLNPASALLATPSTPGDVTLGPQVDGASLSFASPQILLSRDTAQAAFVSAVWKDAAGQPTHQRDVFIVKPDYGVVVDYVYGTAAPHMIIRRFAFPAGNAASDSKGADAVLDSGKTFRVQAIDAATTELTKSTAGQTVVFTDPVATPAPIATVLLTWTSSAAPRVEYVKPSNPLVVKFKVTFPDGRVDNVALAWEARPLHMDGKQFNGWAACSSQGPFGAPSIEIK